MKIYHSLDHFNARSPVVSIGTFDGLHKGHQVILETLKKRAAEIGGESVVFTFYPHPRIVTSPAESNLRLLTTREEKTALFEKFGIDHLIIYPFDKQFAALNYQDFVKQFLVDKMGTKCLVVGYDHKFGKNREGSFEDLKRCANQYGFRIEKLNALSDSGENISSTKIRAALQQGEIAKANYYLGHTFSLNKIIPGYGVYAVNIEIGGKEYHGMLNIGTRPTFNKNADNRSIEVNIFDFNENIYGQKITLLFIDKIRDEKKFPGVEQLVQQLKKDKQTALEILS